MSIDLPPVEHQGGQVLPKHLRNSDMGPVKRELVDEVPETVFLYREPTGSAERSTRLK